MSLLKHLKFLAPLLLSCAPLSAGEINFVYPLEGASLPGVARTFVFGNVSPATAPFSINGTTIAVHANGGFIAYLPVSAGDFSFSGVLADGATAQRTVRVKRTEPPKPEDGKRWLVLDTNSADMEVLPSESVWVRASGTPGLRAEFSIDGMVRGEPMSEVPAGSGRYIGSYRTRESDAGASGFVSARFRAGLFGQSAGTRGKGRVKVLKEKTLVETSTDTVILYNSPDGDFMLFLPKGVKLLASGFSGGKRRVELSASETGWVNDSQVLVSSSGVPAEPPFTETGAIRLKKTDYGSQAVIAMYDRVPYGVEVTETGLRLTLYYASLHTDWVVYDSSDTFVKNVVFRQSGSHKAEIDFETGRDPIWGYNVSYSGSNLLLELRRRPALNPARTKPLEGLVVVVDAGHSPYLKCENGVRRPLHEARFASLPASARCSLDGAVGPMATFEVDVNLAIAQKLKSRLLELGADVRMTRNGEENVDLADRPKLARDLGGDIFVSVHNNAIADGEDPFAHPRGFETYYYHRHSRELAASVQESYIRNIPLPDEGLRYGDYRVVRLTWMPSILTESAYMIFPEQEELLNTPSFQESLASAIAEGVLNFIAGPAAR